MLMQLVTFPQYAHQPCYHFGHSGRCNLGLHSVERKFLTTDIAGPHLAKMKSLGMSCVKYMVFLGNLLVFVRSLKMPVPNPLANCRSSLSARLSWDLAFLLKLCT